jgi:hypothetical protein
VTVPRTLAHVRRRARFLMSGRVHH